MKWEKARKITKVCSTFNHTNDKKYHFVSLDLNTVATMFNDQTSNVKVYSRTIGKFKESNLESESFFKGKKRP